MNDDVRADAALNAVTKTLDERALAWATQIDAQVGAGMTSGPLAGVPFAAKDLFYVAGLVTRAGAVVTATDPPAVRDADAAAALERAGAILIGLTNMDEFAYGFTTENAHNGTTRNPRGLDRIAGGSLRGSASAVAAAIVPLSFESDTNGSIRVPAALCAIYGLRPSRPLVRFRACATLLRARALRIRHRLRFLRCAARTRHSLFGYAYWTDINNHRRDPY